jgi:hypothetical protein
MKIAIYMLRLKLHPHFSKWGLNTPYGAKEEALEIDG